MNAQAAEALFDPEFLRKLERLELLARKIFRGLVRGEHSTRHRGRGLEFSDYRRYQSGDDLRYIDWNIFSRLDRLFLKLYASDEDLTLHLLIDCSASMGFGEPLKFDYARKLAAALAYIGLNNLDRVGVRAFSAGASVSLPTLKSKQHMATLLPFLRRLNCADTTGFVSAMREFAMRSATPGVVVVITDLLSDDELADGLELLRHGNHDVALVQILSEDEINPPLEGPFNLVDAEDRSSLKVTVDAGLRQLYLTRLQAHLEALEQHCREQGIEYLRASTAIPFEDLVLKYLRRGRQWR
ncbi:MAG: DUF58 domain-containing protein [Gammaproteobacteria bacterium]